MQYIIIIVILLIILLAILKATKKDANLDFNKLVELLGGNLEIKWNENDNHVYMTGTATIVFRGRI